MGCAPRTALCASLVLVLAACSAHKPVQHTAIPLDDARRTLSVGFQQLSDRYVEFLPVAQLAYEGVRGLNTIDHDFEIERDADAVSFRLGDGPRHRLTLPGEGDAEGWAALTLDVVRIAQEESPAVAAAPLERIYEAVFDGSLSLLDTNSRYASADEAMRNRDKRSGFGGIGVVVKNTMRGASIVQILAESPAIEAGLVEGDLITHIDSLPVGKSKDASDIARGPIGTNVSLRIERRSGEVVDIDIRRQRVIAPTVAVEIRDGVITATVSGFNRSTARHLASQLTEAIQRFDGGARGIVLDLRGNPGGLLSEAVRVADLFIPSGRILATRGRHPASVHDYDAREDDVASGLPIVVLVNGRSASAAEIVAAALQDHDRAVVVGSSSYGKGTVQMIVPLPNDGELTVTWSQFVTPSGYVLNGLGVHPSICTSRLSASAEQIIRRTLDGGADIATTFEQWRSVDRRPIRDRKSLKETCPASEAMGDLDRGIAANLLGDESLYQRILGFVPTTVASRK